MMNANVRRLVFDRSPRGLSWVVLFCWMISGILAAEFALGQGRANALMVYSAGAWAMLGVGKIPAWRTLPVSQKDLRQAQFWQFIGIPYLLTFSSAFIGVAVMAAAGFLRASWIEILGLMSVGTLVALTMGASPLLRTMLGNLLGPVGSLIATSIPMIGAIGLASFVLIGEVNRAVLLTVNWLGALSLILFHAALIFNQSLPLALPVSQIKTPQASSLVPHPPVRFIAGRPTARPSGFWTLFGWSFWRVAPYAAFTLGAYAIFGIATRYAPASSVLLAVYSLQLIPLFSLLASLSPTLIDFQRVRAGLPISVFKRTLAIHLVSPALLVPTWVVMIGVTALAHPAAISPKWWIDCGLSSLMASALTALAAPLQMRFGQKGFALFLATFSGLWSFMLARGGASTWNPTFAGLMTLALLAGWIWTYLELAYGRKAYQNRAPALARWRGAAS